MHAAALRATDVGFMASKATDGAACGGGLAADFVNGFFHKPIKLEFEKVRACAPPPPRARAARAKLAGGRAAVAAARGKGQRNH